MTYREATQLVKNALSSGPPSDDFSLSDEYIAAMLGVVRANFLKQRVERSKLGNDAYQTITCSVQSVEDVNGCDRAVLVGDILTVNTMPQIDYVGAKGYKHSYIYVTSSQVPYLRYGRYTSKTRSFFYKGKWIYLLGDSYIKHVTVRAVFQDPIDGYRLCNIQGNPCNLSLNYEFPIPDDLMDHVVSRVKEELGPKGLLRIPQDIKSDTKDDIPPDER